MASTNIGKVVRANIVLFGALFANLGIAVAKFVAAGITGSSSMLSEGFHSLVDSGNQLLLLYGQHRAKRPPDVRHPFGYGRELYFWAFVVAILIFALGSGISVYEGWQHIRDPEPLRDPTLNYVVLGLAALLEGASWSIAVREFRQGKGDVGWWKAVKDSKDPPGFIVLFEDSAALAGLFVAAVGVWASHAWDDPRIDGVASIVIGLILAAVAMLLAREAKGLLIGERADPRVVERVRALVAESPGVTAVNHVRTIHTAPDAIFVAISADFDDRLTMGEGETLIERIEARLRSEFSELSSIYVRPEKREDAVVAPTDTADGGPTDRGQAGARRRDQRCSRMIDHIGLNITDLEVSRAFYEAALAPLGIRTFRTETNSLGNQALLMGDEEIFFVIADGEVPSKDSHVAFRARTAAEVDAFHAASLAAGGRDNGAPGLRPQYGGRYYAAFALDPDGINVEAVCHLPE